MSVGLTGRLAFFPAADFKILEIAAGPVRLVFRIHHSVDAVGMQSGKATWVPECLRRFILEPAAPRGALNARFNICKSPAFGFSATGVAADEGRVGFEIGIVVAGPVLVALTISLTGARLVEVK